MILATLPLSTIPRRQVICDCILCWIFFYLHSTTPTCPWRSSFTFILLITHRTLIPLLCIKCLPFFINNLSAETKKEDLSNFGIPNFLSKIAIAAGLPAEWSKNSRAAGQQGETIKWRATYTTDDDGMWMDITKLWNWSRLKWLDRGIKIVEILHILSDGPG